VTGTTLALIITTTVTAMVGLSMAVRWTRKAFAWCRGLAAAVQQVNKRSEQLLPNGGSSMRDEVAQTRAEMTRQRELLEAQQELLDAQREVIADLQARPRLGVRLRR
jgi:hypothetical protein